MGKPSRRPTLKAQIERLANRINELEGELYVARRLQYDAQAGLANYMKEHGLGHRIGYDVTQDPMMGPFAPRAEQVRKQVAR